VTIYVQQRKVKFPAEYDALDLVTEDLKKQLEPVARRLKEIERDRAERRKVTYLLQADWKRNHRCHLIGP
jgi:hypothetical protein